MWKTYFQYLLVTADQATYINRPETKEELVEDSPDILVTEMSVQYMYSNRSPGVHNNTVEVYKK